MYFFYCYCSEFLPFHRTYLIFVFLQKVNEARESQREYYEKELVKLQARLEGEAAQLKEAHSKTLEELAWKHHTAIEAAHTNANKDKKKLQMVGLCFLSNKTYCKKQMLEFEPWTSWFCCMASFIWSYLQICWASLKKLLSLY